MQKTICQKPGCEEESKFLPSLCEYRDMVGDLTSECQGLNKILELIQVHNKDVWQKLKDEFETTIQQIKND